MFSFFLASSGSGSGNNSTSHSSGTNSTSKSNPMHNEIKQQLASLQASVEFIMANICQTLPEKADRLDKFIIKPVSNRQELQELEDNLKNEIFFSKTLDAMTFICGSSGKSRGVDSCYKLIDHFFTRDLLVNCSWTGSSRQADECKIPLKYFNNIRKCFLTLVSKADRNFGEQECEKFLKTITKNAKQRLTSKITSTSKNRVKKSTTVSARKRQLAPVFEQGEQDENQAEGQNNQREEIQEQREEENQVEEEQED